MAAAKVLGGNAARLIGGPGRSDHSGPSNCAGVFWAGTCKVMLARVRTGALWGIDAIVVDVEVDVSAAGVHGNGLPAIDTGESASAAAAGRKGTSSSATRSTAVASPSTPNPASQA